MNKIVSSGLPAVMLAFGLSCSQEASVCPGGGSTCQIQPDAESDPGKDDSVDGMPSEDPDLGGADLVEEPTPWDGSADPTVDPPIDPTNDPRWDSSDNGFDSSDGSRVFRLDVQPQLTLPYTVEGGTVGSATLELYEVGGAASVGAVQVEVTGPFNVSGSLSPLGAQETRPFTVSYTGSAAQPALVDGSARFSVDGQVVEAGLAAVIGDAEIPVATWTADDYGSWTLVDMPSAPFPDDSASWTDETVLVLVPHDLVDTRDVGVVLHIHGHNAIVEDRVAEQWLGEQHTLSGRNAVFIAPQGPVSYPSGNFGKLMDPDGAYNLVRDVFALLYRDGFIERPVIGDLVVTSHSGGYLATAAIITVGGLPTLAVHLYDSLYGELEDFEDFALDGGVLRSNYTSGGGTGTNNQTLASRLDDHLTVATGFTDGDLWSSDVTIGFSAATHANCMNQERTAARWLTTSGLAPRPDAGPELLRAIHANGQVQVEWRPDRGDQQATYRVQGSHDGEIWETLADTNLTEATVDPHPWLKVVRSIPGWGESGSSDVYGSTGSDWLVVDGFDRVLGGSYFEPTHPFAAYLGNALSRGFSVASNEAVAEGLVDLDSFDHVLWMLGDESSRDLTFDAVERTLVKDFIQAGGSIIVTGSELGYASDRTWLTQTLHATYVSDDANTTQAGSYTFGVTYPEDYPDVLSGQTAIWTYSTGGAAAVVWNSQVIAVGFPLETIGGNQRAAALSDLLGQLD